MLPEVKAYIDATKGAENKHQSNVARSRLANPTTTIGITQGEFNAAVERRNADWHDSADALKCELDAAKRHLTESDNALVRWIAENAISMYSIESQDVLEALPMTREALQSFGGDQGWCPEYGRLYREAEEAGVLPPFADPETEAVAKLALWLKHNTDSYTSVISYQAAIRRHLPEIFAKLIDVDGLVETLFNNDTDDFRKEAATAQLREWVIQHIKVNLP